MHAWLIEFRPRRLRMMVNPAAQRFHGRSFAFHPHGESFQESLSFDWESLDRMLPSLHGTITLRRIGPFALLKIDAKYRIAADTSGRLLSASVGRKNGLLSLRYLRQALHSIVTTVADPLHGDTVVHDSK